MNKLLELVIYNLIEEYKVKRELALILVDKYSNVVNDGIANNMLVNDICENVIKSLCADMHDVIESKCITCKANMVENMS